MDRGTANLQARLVLSPPAAASNSTPGHGARLFLPADVKQLLVLKEEVSPDWSLKQDVPEPPHIKEEDEELGISHHGEQPDGQQEELVTAVPFTAVIVKSEGDGEKEEAEFSQLHHSQTEDDGKTAHPSSSLEQQIKSESKEELVEPQADPDDSWRSEQGGPSHFETVDGYGEWQEPLSDSGPEAEDGDGVGKKCRYPESGSGTLQHCKSLSSDGRREAGGDVSSCSECGDRFQQLDNLQRHIQFQSGKTSSSSWEVNKPNADSQTSCRRDDAKRFGERSSLNVHTSIHLEEKPLTCDICGKRFTFKANLRKHVRVHTGEKPFGCKVCGKRFNQTTNLKSHMRVHTGEKPFGCNVCGKRFTFKANRENHVRIHTGEKPFWCDVCGKNFNRKANLKTHMRVHTRKAHRT